MYIEYEKQIQITMAGPLVYVHITIEAAEELLAFERVNCSRSLEVALYPIDVFGNARINPRVSRFSALVAERNDANLNPSAVSPKHQRSAGIALTGVLSSLTVTGA